MINKTVKLYSSHPHSISQKILQGETHYAKTEFIRKKYGADVAPIFTQAYNWFNRQAQKVVPIPNDEAESPIWAYYELRNMEKHVDYDILELSVPLDQVIFFKMADWNRILNQRFIGDNRNEEEAFSRKLESQGINYEGDVFRKPFYPQLKKEIENSWGKLFRFHEDICNSLKAGVIPEEKDIQAAIWMLPKEWVLRVIP